MNALKLKAIMVERGMKQKELLDRTGISSTTFNRRMKDGKWNLPDAQKIINVLNIQNPGEIFFDKPGT